MKTKKIILSLFIFTTLVSSIIAERRSFPDNAFQSIPDSCYAVCPEEGVVFRYVYEVKNRVSSIDSKIYKKTALVYLPYGFDENDTETEYNVMYLMHGHEQSPEFFFDGVNCNSLLKKIIDSQIYEKKLAKTIFCAVTFWEPYSADVFSNAQVFNQELREDLMPLFEEKYHIRQNRNARGFGGFSMGSMTTWTIFENCLDLISHYAPISGDARRMGGNSSKDQGKDVGQILSEKVISQGYTKDDFMIYSGCGANEMATPFLVPQMDKMKSHPDVFVFADNYANGNCYFELCPKSGHDISTVLTVLYNGLPKFFPGTN
ncbi:MAG: hypothetical protein KIG91_05550 [Treponema sp.]|nr:hypothetical protein [Treponema sp.]